MSPIAKRLTHIVPDLGFIYYGKALRRLQREMGRVVYQSEMIDAMLELNDMGIPMRIYRQGELKIRRVV